MSVGIVITLRQSKKCNIASRGKRRCRRNFTSIILRTLSPIWLTWFCLKRTDLWGVSEVHRNGYASDGRSTIQSVGRKKNCEACGVFGSRGEKATPSTDYADSINSICVICGYDLVDIFLRQ